MAVIINEIEVVLEPPKSPEASGGKGGEPEKQPMDPQDLLTVINREQHIELRLRAH